MKQKTMWLASLAALAAVASGGGCRFFGSSPKAMDIRNPRYVLEDGSASNKKYGRGDDLTLAFDLIGAPLNDQGAPDLVVRFDVTDPAGRRLLETVELPVNAKPPEGSADSLPLQFHLTLPVFAVGGDHTIAIAAQDRLRGKSADLKAHFFVDAPNVPADAKLGLQDHVFTKGEGGAVVPDAAFAPGSRVHTRFRLAGFRPAADQTVRVRVELVVLSESGETLLTQPDLLHVDEKFFYAPTYLPATAYVDTPSSAPAGRYRMRYKVIDQVAGREETREETFTIR